MVKYGFVLTKIIPFRLKLFVKGANLTFECSKYCGKTRYKSPAITNRKKAFRAKSNDMWCLGMSFFVFVHLFLAHILHYKKGTYLFMIITNAYFTVCIHFANSMQIFFA